MKPSTANLEAARALCSLLFPDPKGSTSQERIQAVANLIESYQPPSLTSAPDRDTTGAKAIERLKTLRTLMGYVENGTSTPVHIYQDDATKEYGLRFGEGSPPRYLNAASFEGLLDIATEYIRKTEQP